MRTLCNKSRQNFFPQVHPNSTCPKLLAFFSWSCCKLGLWTAIALGSGAGRCLPVTMIAGGGARSDRVRNDPRVRRSFSGAHPIPLTLRGDVGPGSHRAKECTGSAVPEALQHGHGKH